MREKKHRNVFLHSKLVLDVFEHVFFAHHVVGEFTDDIPKDDRQHDSCHFFGSFLEFGEFFLMLFLRLHIRRHLRVIFAHFLTASALASSDLVVSNEVNVFSGILMITLCFF